VILETSFGVGAAISGVSSGYWYDAQGYLQPIIVITALQFVAFFMIFLLPDSLKIREKRNETSCSITDDGNKKERGGYGSCGSEETGLFFFVWAEFVDILILCVRNQGRSQKIFGE